ncbi:hypothetical protein P3339_00915 [Microbulbifer sp. MLAF003]|uniref:hypothetical protein n=1 Tax=Microbulbifer sp. MLAF003 TaxID=3032582 RepID=UPI0024ACF2BC|nr:hypothetical protein [Microbulbifer sp. MLAF003]WHI51429.1 hypothetical protein P3339_00915 [Microbulbifer sp. MLAF003]
MSPTERPFTSTTGQHRATATTMAEPTPITAPPRSAEILAIVRGTTIVGCLTTTASTLPDHPTCVFAPTMADIAATECIAAIAGIEDIAVTEGIAGIIAFVEGITAGDANHPLL